MLKYCIYYLSLLSITLSADPQNSTIKSCGMKLYDSITRIYKSDSLRIKGLSGVFNPATNNKITIAQNEWSDCVKGKSIPILNFSTIHGKKYNTSNLKGKILVLNFWFKACKPCVAEMPSLNKLRNEFKGRDVIFIGFASDSENALKTTYLNSNKFLFEIVSDSKNIAKEFYFDGYPTTFIVNQTGTVVKAWTGYVHDPYAISKPIINQLLSDF